MSFDFTNEDEPIYETRPRQSQAYRDAPRRGGFGIPSLVCGVVGLVIAFIPCMGIASLPLAILAVVLGLISLGSSSTGSGLAGLVTGLCTLAIWAIITFFFAAAISDANNAVKREQQLRQKQETEIQRQEKARRFRPPLPE